jgi:group I intron endonuclease
MNKKIFALVERIKRKGSELYQLFPINHRLKYPIFFDKLIERIKSLKINYNKLGLIHIYQNVELNKKVINKDLKNKGGIYLWWCKSTGLFYIGSAKSFVGKNGRLNEYFQKNRLLNRINSKISSDIAKDMLIYPKSNWNLIILEICLQSRRKDDLNLRILKEKEQFWMLLLPTYNRSLVVGSNEGLPLSEEQRESISTLIYIYEISDDGKLIPNSEQKIYGIKELSRIGIKSKFSDLITAANSPDPFGRGDIQAYLKSGLPFKNKYLLLKNSLTLEQQINWKQSVKIKGSGVWVYDYITLEFIEHFDTVKACQDKYKIPSTTFKRLRKHRLNYKGYLFSNYKL